MKTKLLIITWILFPLLAFSQFNPNDLKWESEKRNFRNNFDVSYLKDQKNTFYYLMDNYIKITSNNKDRKLTKVAFENGEVKKISDDIYCIIPNKIGRYDLTINDESQSYTVIELPVDKIEIKFSASNSPFPNCISFDDFMRSNKINASFNLKKFKIRCWGINWEYKDLGINSETRKNSDSIDESVKNDFKNNFINIGAIQLNYILIFLYDSIKKIPPQSIKVVDNYQNEYIRRTLMISSETNNLKLLKNDMRIKLVGNYSKGDNIIINDLVNEFNGILGTIKFKIVDIQPSLTIVFDTIKYKSTPPYGTSQSGVIDFYEKLAEMLLKKDSSLKADGYKTIHHVEAYYKEMSNKFFPFNKKIILYLPYWSLNDVEYHNYHENLLKRCMIAMLANFRDDNAYESFLIEFNDKKEHENQARNLLKMLYTPGGEEKVMTILNEGNVKNKEKPIYVLLLVLTISLLFVFSEIYKYYGIGNLISKVRFKIIKKMIEAVLFAQLPILAWLIISLINNNSNQLFQEALFFESMLIPICVLSGILIFFLDKLLEKIKTIWLNIMTDLILSFFCIALAYQLVYLFITPEIIRISYVGWEILLIPFLVTLYRLYIRFEKNKITSLLQEKELELSKQKELKFKSDLNALQARINPHFLYNALNSLASLTHIDQDRTEKMALSLSKLFRYNINKNEELYAPLKDEIEMAEIYLQVEKNRFEDRLYYSIELQEKLKEFVIPRFILQPLAENAVKHGISKITGKGVIRINIFEEAQKVFIEIYDNGPQFPGGLISGYGLQNVYEKLKLLYKKPFDISFINSPEKKLVIALTK